LIDPTQYTKNRDRYTKQNHEFRISSPADFPLRATAGLFYQRQTDDIRAEFDADGLFVSNDAPPAAPAIQSVTGQPNSIYISQMDRTDRDYAVFTDVTYDITDKFKMAAGIRKFWVENGLYGFFGFQSYETNAIKGCDQAKGVPIVYPVTGNRPCVDTNTKVVADGETHRLNFQYQIDPDLMVYTTYSTGYRPGGVNRVTTAAPYRADTLTNIELGWKTSWLDHHVRFNGAVFYEHWKDVQVATQGQYGITSIQNLGKADIKGIESELEWAAAEHLVLGVSGTYVDAKTTTDFCTPDPKTGYPVASCAVPDTVKGSRLPVTPQLKGDATARYKFNVGNFASFAQVAVIHQSSSVPTIEGTKNVLIGTIPGFTTEDFSVGTGMNNWHVEAYIENAFDSHGELSRGTECGTADCAAHYRSFLIKPMNFGVKFGQKF
jgi:iron complex outermembrane receptor protein